ncbi:MAG: substrate-binding domain-containing protein [Kiritimatiellae bacterium]|nr:substrate-binding domain-containing protein [Kiritimatiellia bacterium]
MGNRRKTAAGISHRVVVALRMAGIAGQDKLNGIFEHLSAGRRWQLMIYRTKQEFTAETVTHELSRGAEGFIVGIPGADDALGVLAASCVPTVVLNVTGGGIEKRNGKIAFVRSDGVAVGREAASALLGQGIYRSYGYAGYRTDDDWSRERGEAFRAALKAAGFPVRMFDVAHARDGVEDKAATIEWLKGLPKPCGILAACDDRAFEILDICRETGIAVPGEVGVIGVNNDPILCENAEPRLTSVQPDFIGEGRLAAELLERMMAGNDIDAGPEGRTRRVGVKAVVARDSTMAQSEAGRFVQRVLAYIGRNAIRGIGVRDVARKFKVSTSLLELRFRQFQGESLYAAMLGIRLEEVRRRLRGTNDAIEDITFDCGWENPIPPKALFKKRFGVSMRDYRRMAAR